jgi:pimeloyl-ACP methyl ester carboxylesterase
MAAAGSAWDWHLVAPTLRERGHDPVAVDLPSEDESAGWSEHTDTFVRAVGDRSDLVVVGHSFGGFTAPLVCARLPAKLLVLVAGMIPSPGEFFSDWWRNSGYEETGYEDVFYHDVPPALAAEARRRERNESSKALKEPWPLMAWPETPTRYLLCRDDRMFSAAWARRHAHERLGGDERAPPQCCRSSSGSPLHVPEPPIDQESWWQSLWQSGRRDGPRQERTSQTTDPT